jgi:LmbE family N-acetylglucosaminyl deacetylase
MSENLTTPKRALAIAAHPDDVEFQCGATFAKWAAAGCVINHLICTDGSKGSWDPQADTAELVRIRQAEQREAAQILGSTGEVVFLGAIDGELESTRDMVSKVARWIRVLTPDVVIAHDPWTRWRLHPDHFHAGRLAVEGIVGARDPHFFPEHGVAHHRPDELLLFESEEPDHVEDVSGFEQQKIDALLAHVSQFETTMYIDDAGSGRIEFDQRIRSELTQAARDAASVSAEAFKRINDL